MTSIIAPSQMALRVRLANVEKKTAEMQKLLLELCHCPDIDSNQLFKGQQAYYRVVTRLRMIRNQLQEN